MEEIKTPQECKQDMIDRKGAWLERMFDRLFAAILKNPFAALLVLAVAGLFYQQGVINHINELRLSDKDKSNQEMVNEVRRTVDHQMAPIQAQTDSNSRKIDTSLINLNGTVESVKQYIKKKAQ